MIFLTASFSPALLIHLFSSLQLWKLLFSQQSLLSLSGVPNSPVGMLVHRELNGTEMSSSQCGARNPAHAWGWEGLVPGQHHAWHSQQQLSPSPTPGTQPLAQPECNLAGMGPAWRSKTGDPANWGSSFPWLIALNYWRVGALIMLCAASFIPLRITICSEPECRWGSRTLPWHTEAVWDGACPLLPVPPA